MICALARQRALPLRAAHPLLHPKICARNDNPNTVSFYDAFDRRIIKTHDPDGPGTQPATTTKTLYDGAHFAANAYADFDGSDALTMRYLFGPAVDMILARRNASGTVAWYLADHLGSVRDLANTSGTVIDHISYSAFGKVTAESQSSNGDRFKYTAREYDSELAQYYYRARHYDPTSGRFLSNDPIGFGAGDANLYRYVVNSPLNAIDPTGEDIVITGDPDYVAKVQADIAKLKSTPSGKAVIKQLEESKKTIVIQASDPGKGNSYKPGDGTKATNGTGSGGVIKYDPDNRKGGKDVTGSNNRPPRIGLGHEAKHAADAEKGKLGSTTKGPKGYPNKAEKDAVDYENKIRKESKLPLRDDSKY